MQHSQEPPDLHGLEARSELLSVQNRKDVSFYQLEPDFFFKEHTLAGFGRYALFRVAGHRLRSARAEPDDHPASRWVQRAPPRGCRRRSRVSLPLIGRGSARVYSSRSPPDD